jgi:tyrosine aminotransferase
VIPALLQENNVAIQEWKLQLRRTLETQGSFLCRQLAAAPGLQVMKPGGAMYAMVRIDTEQFDESIQNEIDFTRLLLQEENVFVLPGSCFDLPYAAFRVVFCAPVPVLRTAADRIVQFCSTHRK